MIIHGKGSQRTFQGRLIGTEDEWQEIDMSKLTAQEIKKYEDKETNEPVTTLEELLDVFKGTGKVCNLEIKDYDPKIAEIALDVVIQKDMLDFVFFSSFRHEMRDHLRAAAKKRGIEKLPFGYLIAIYSSLNPAELEEHFVEGDRIIMARANVDVEFEFFEEKRKKLKEIGIKFSLWYSFSKNIESVEDYGFLVSKGFDLIIVNDMAVAEEYEG
jgi:hypothetical protein